MSEARGEIHSYDKDGRHVRTEYQSSHRLWGVVRHHLLGSGMRVEYKQGHPDHGRVNVFDDNGLLVRVKHHLKNRPMTVTEEDTAFMSACTAARAESQTTLDTQL